MTQEPKRRRGGQRKLAAERKRNNLTFRVRDQLKADLEKAAAASNRSVSEEIEFRLGQAFQWEKVLGDLEAFKEEQRQTEAAMRYRGWWSKINPNMARWLDLGTHNIPQSGFEPSTPPQPGLPPLMRDLVRDEVQTAVRQILEEAGLLAPKKKSGGGAA
jgi:hypothetical protein